MPSNKASVRRLEPEKHPADSHQLSVSSSATLETATGNCNPLVQTLKGDTEEPHVKAQPKANSRHVPCYAQRAAGLPTLTDGLGR